MTNEQYERVDKPFRIAILAVLVIFGIAFIATLLLFAR